MAALDPGRIELFRWADQLPVALWQDLEQRDPEQAAAACGARREKSAFILPILGRNYRVDPGQRLVQDISRPGRRVSYQAGMILVTTLARAQDIPPSGRMITPQELPGGRFFYAGPHELPLAPITARFGHRPRDLRERARLLGGGPWEEVEGVDAAVMLPGLPRVPLYVLLWAQDQEFEARAVVGVDERAHFHLALDALWALCNILARRLCEDHHA